MSLRVWLPLISNTKNLGLCGDNLITSNVTFNDGGKIGNKYLSGGTITIPASISKTFFNKNHMSFAFWLYPIGSTSSSVIMGRTVMSAGDNRMYSIFQYSTPNDLHLSWQDETSSSTFLGGAWSGFFPADVWTHCCIVYDGKKAMIYRNGELYTTANGTSNRNNFEYDFPIVGSPIRKLNDVRIYDHALSPLEVKHIAQGLILHYPLNREGWGNDNILINTHFDSQTTKTSGWDTTKNGTQMASSWGGFNGGVSNPSTVYHAHLKQVNNEWVYEYIRTADEGWLGISQGGLQLKLIAGKTYTFSWEEYRVEGNNYPTGGLYYFKTGATSANFHLGQFGGSHGNVLGKWRKFSYTFVAPTDGDYSKNISWYIYGQSGGNGKMYMRHPKLEEGSVATPWCPNSSDALATTMGLNDNVEYDTSGYGNNGEYYAYDTNGSISYTSDTPKYNVSTHIASANPTQNVASGTRYLYGHCELTNPMQMSVAFWLKPIKGYGDKTSQGQFCTTNYAYGDTSVGSDFQNSAMNHRDNTVNINDSGGTAQCKPIFIPAANEWHHYVVTYDGQVGRLYKDGVQSSTSQFDTAKSLGSFIGVVIGFSKAGGVWRKNDSYYSDFRIYVTALSAEDVKDLYELGATIDTNGVLSTYEFTEQ